MRGWIAGRHLRGPIAAALISVCICSISGAALIYGDLVIDETNGHLLRVSADGSVTQTLLSTNRSHCTGAALTGDWNVVRCYGISLGQCSLETYNSQAGTVSSYSVPEVYFPRDVNFFADGTIVIPDRGPINGTIPKIELYTAAGTHSATISLPSGSFPSGFAIDSDSTMWISDQTPTSGLLLHYGEDGSALGTITLPSYMEFPRDVVLAPDGTLWVEDEYSRIAHVRKDGTAFATNSRFQNGIGGPSNQGRGIELDPSGNILTCDVYNLTTSLARTTYLDRYSPSGVLLQSIHLPDLLSNSNTEIDYPASGGLTLVTPEPAALCALALFALPLRRARKRWRGKNAKETGSDPYGKPGCGIRWSSIREGSALHTADGWKGHACSVHRHSRFIIHHSAFSISSPT